MANGEEGLVPWCDLGLKSIFYLEIDFLKFEQRFQKAGEDIFSQRPLKQTQHINPRDTSSAAPHSPADLHIRTYLVDGKVPSLPPSTIRVFPLQYAPARDARYSNAPAMSFSSPRRPAGMLSLETLVASGLGLGSAAL